MPPSRQKKNPTTKDGLPAKALLIDSFLAVLVFALHLCIVGVKCGDMFCFTSDPYWYWNTLEFHNYDDFLIGKPVFVLMDFVNGITSMGPIWSIRITAALLSAIFFLLFALLLGELHKNYWFSRLFSFFSVFSLWWMVISSLLYKNELGAVITLFLIYNIMQYAKSPGCDRLFWVVAAFLALLLSHASSTVFVVAVFAIYAVFLGISHKKIPHIVAGIAIMGLLFFNPITGTIFHAKDGGVMFQIVYSSENTLFLSAYALLLPVSFYGFWAMRKKHPFSLLFISFLCATGLLGIFAATDWSWRFLLDGFWVSLLGTFSFLLFFAGKMSGPELVIKNPAHDLQLGLPPSKCHSVGEPTESSRSPYGLQDGGFQPASCKTFGKCHLLQFLSWLKQWVSRHFPNEIAVILLAFYAVIAILIICNLSLASIENMKPTYTLEDVQILSSFISEYQPVIYLPMVDSGSLVEMIKRIDPNQEFHGGVCPAGAENNTWMIKRSNDSMLFFNKQDEKTYADYVKAIYSGRAYYRAGNIDFIKCS